jgi:hypothetical protein
MVWVPIKSDELVDSILFHKLGVSRIAEASMACQAVCVDGVF